jgi:hypothetical protein
MVRAWLTGTLDLDLGTMSPQAAVALRQHLTLTQQGFDTQEPVPFYLDSPGWMHIPKGYWFHDFTGCLQGVQVADGRSDGFPLPPGTRAHVTFGTGKFPPGQPQFIEDACAATRMNGHGGLLVAPTRSGKTLCSVEIACRLGGSTLILVDSGELMDQWREEIATHVRVPVGIIREQRFDYGPRWPFVVGMVQTLARRRLSDDARRSWRTVILDECKMAPAATVWGALRRLYSRYVFGLSATPDRSDGLGQAVAWIIGPTIATLDRRMEADVLFLPVPWRACKIPKECADGQTRNYAPKLVRRGKTSWVEAEKSLMRDEKRMELLLRCIMEEVYTNGRKPLVMVGLKDHAKRWADALQRCGLDVGRLWGQSSRFEGSKQAVVAGYKKAGQGLSIKPPADLFVPAGPVRDIRQAMGRALEPEVAQRTLILDPVDQVHELRFWAGLRQNTYMQRGFRLLSKVYE